jgi:TRAP-type C4-dicarboxylate transport system permease small subunit
MSEAPDPRVGSGQRNAVFTLVSTIDRAFSVVERAIVGGGIILMATVMTLHVLGRILFNRGIQGSTEITEILIIVVTFIGVAYAARNARHISMSAIYDQLRGKVRKGLLLVISIGTAVLMFYFAWESLIYTLDIYERGRVSSTLHFPQWIVIATVPIGFTLAGIQYTLTTVRNLMSDEIYRSFTEKEQYSDVLSADVATDRSPEETHEQH